MTGKQELENVLYFMGVKEKVYLARQRNKLSYLFSHVCLQIVVSSQRDSSFITDESCRIQ